MKRDPRLRRSSEQRSSAHGGKYGRRPRYRATQTRSDAVARIARGMHLPPELLGLGSAFLFGHAERDRLYVDHVLRPHAERVTADLSAQLRDDLTFRGEAYVHVGYDLEREAVTYERIPPDEIS